MEDADASRLTDAVHVERGRGDPFAAAIRASCMAMVITDPRKPDNPIIFANDAFCRLSGYPRQDVIGRNCRFLQGPGTDQRVVTRIRQSIQEGRDVAVEILNYRHDGRPFWNALYVSPVTSEAGELNYFFASQLDVTDRRQSHIDVQDERDRVEEEIRKRTAELEEALAAKSLLLHEVDHRVKNNLQMISSLIILQSRRIADPAVRQSLMSMLERVEALSLVHRRLYQSDDVTKFDVGEFVRDLANELLAITGRSDVHFDFDLDSIVIRADQAAPIALIFNELLVNSLKHAFPERAGVIRLQAKQAPDGIDLEVADDGAGMPADDTGNPSFGRTLMQAMARQLHAEIAWHEQKPGTRVHAHIPLPRMS